MSRIVIDARELRTSSGRYVERLLHYLPQVDTKHKYTVLLKPKDIEGWQPPSRRMNVVACRYKEFSFGEQLGLWRQVKKLRPDLVHFAFAQQPILYRGPVVTTMHDLTTVRFRNPSKNWLIFTLKQWVYKWVNYIVAHKSAAIITPTDYVKEDIARFANLNSRKITVTYEAADPITDEPEAIESLIDTRFIMYLGRPQPHKNLWRLCQAFAQLKPTHPELKLVLAGKTDAIYRQLARQVDQAGIEDVVFTDFVSEGQLRWLYEQTAAYVFPSLSEGFGLPGLEAMLHGAPVASSNATCLPELYGSAVAYFDPLNITEMAETIDKLLTNKAYADKLRTLGRAQAAQYSWKRMAEQTIELYNQVLEHTS